MLIPENSLTEEIAEIVQQCNRIAAEYGKNATEFKQPANEEELNECEQRLGVLLPEMFKDWLRFSNGCSLMQETFRFNGTNTLDFDKYDQAKEYVVLGTLFNDGSMLCLDKFDGQIYRDSDGGLTDYNDFKDFLNRVVIRSLKRS